MFSPTEGPVVKPTVLPVADTVNGGGGGWVRDGDGELLVLVPGVGESGEPKFQPVVASPVGAGVEEGARAAAVAGAMLGILAAASSLMWALYRFKPGLIGPGGGGALSISSPVSSTRYQPVSSHDTPLTGVRTGGGMGDGGGSGGGGSGGASGKKYGSTSFMVTKTDMANGGASSAATAHGTMSHMGTQTAEAGAGAFSNYFAYSSSSAAGSSSAAAISGHKPGTMTRAIQTDLAYQASGGAGGGAGGGFGGSSLTTVRNTNVTNVYNTDTKQQIGGSGYDAADQGTAWMQSQSQSGQGYGQGYGDAYTSSAMTYEDFRGRTEGPDFIGYSSQVDRGYSGMGTGQGQAVRTISPLPTDPNSLYQMRNLTLNYSALNQQGIYDQQQQLGVARQNLMTEEIRVDCVQMTTNGRYVVTGSIFGPPQVWDMKVCKPLYLSYLICYW